MKKFIHFIHPFKISTLNGPKNEKMSHTPNKCTIQICRAKMNNPLRTRNKHQASLLGEWNLEIGTPAPTAKTPQLTTIFIRNFHFDWLIEHIPVQCFSAHYLCTLETLGVEDRVL